MKKSALEEGVGGLLRFGSKIENYDTYRSNIFDLFERNKIAI